MTKIKLKSQKFTLCVRRPDLEDEVNQTIKRTNIGMNAIDINIRQALFYNQNTHPVNLEELIVKYDELNKANELDKYLDDLSEEMKNEENENAKKDIQDKLTDMMYIVELAKKIKQHRIDNKIDNIHNKINRIFFDFDINKTFSTGEMMVFEVERERYDDLSEPIKQKILKEGDVFAVHIKDDNYYKLSAFEGIEYNGKQLIAIHKDLEDDVILLDIK